MIDHLSKNIRDFQIIYDIYQKPDLRTFDQIMVDISTISNKCRLIVMTVILVLCHSLLLSDLYVWWKLMVNSQVKLLSSSCVHLHHHHDHPVAKWTGWLPSHMLLKTYFCWQLVVNCFIRVSCLNCFSIKHSGHYWSVGWILAKIQFMGVTWCISAGEQVTW